MAYDKNAYNNQYKKDNFDHIGFYTPKGVKEQAQARAQAKGVSLAEYIRELINTDLQKDT